jgi:hypothetical protein
MILDFEESVQNTESRLESRLLLLESEKDNHNLEGESKSTP